MAQKHPPVTLKQVAETAKVSRAAASFALSGKPGVSEATRRRVLQIAEQLGYSPNQTAQNLRSSRTGIIAVYLPENVSTLSYYMEATFGIVDEAELNNLTVTLVPHTPAQAPVARLNADGLIILDPAREDAVVDRLLTLGLPVVTGETPPNPDQSVAGQVVSDHRHTTYEILDHFRSAGAHAPAIITPKERMSWSMSIEGSYVDWCRQHRVEPRIEHTSMDELTASTKHSTRKLLKDGTTDAILALTDGSALAVAAQASEHGRRIGKDLLIAAAVDSPVLSYVDPSVTAVDLNPRDFGRRCTNLLVRILTSDQAPGDEPLTDYAPTTVIYRASTGK
ncbi:LacI family DNA-binding transcriptional regulator [Glutamicibacter sp.]|uniref:LacI family DNA-binding transcriptional regulator n=1 Tax=Glutamicibacter sp. TaxID=1931995 RepID=UPI0028BE289B|nr:LacI family DNA-binding transcriptional regulator [Glutamicibacter sp.]